MNGRSPGAGYVKALLLYLQSFYTFTSVQIYRYLYWCSKPSLFSFFRYLVDDPMLNVLVNVAPDRIVRRSN